MFIHVNIYGHINVDVHRFLTKICMNIHINSYGLNTPRIIHIHVHTSLYIHVYKSRDLCLFMFIYTDI